MTESHRGLKLDRRLIRRRGWIDPQELERELEQLPDVSDKIRPPEETGEGTPGGPAGGDGSSAGA